MTDQFVTVVCNKCNTEYEISVLYAGMPGECGTCGEVFVFPSREDINAAFGYDVCGQVEAAQAAENAAAVPQEIEETPPPVNEPIQNHQEPAAPAFHGAAPDEDEVFTSTIKMSRSKIGGMIPKVNDDEYGFSYVKKNPMTETAPVTQEAIQEIKQILASDESQKQQETSSGRKKWWQYLLFWKKTGR